MVAKYQHLPFTNLLATIFPPNLSGKPSIEAIDCGRSIPPLWGSDGWVDLIMPGVPFGSCLANPQSSVFLDRHPLGKSIEMLS